MAITRGGGGRGGRGVRGGRGGYGGRCAEPIALSNPCPPTRPHVGSPSVMEPQVVSSPTTNNPSISSGSMGDNVTSTQGSKKRGITCGQGARKAMRNAKKRLTVQFDFSLMQAICDNAECFNNEIGYIVRKYCSLRYKEWRNVPMHVRAPLRHKLLILFDIDVEDGNVQKVIDAQMHKAWKGYRFKLHKYFKEIGGEEDPIMAKDKRHEDVSEENWDYLCDLWIDSKYLDKAQKNVGARGQRKSKTRNGSKTTARHHVERGADLHSPTGHIETWRLLVWHPIKGWDPPELEAKYEKMMQMKSDSPQMTDKEILEKVLGRESVRLFGWGRSPSKSRATCAGKEPSRPTYSDVLDELNQYKSRVKELEGSYQMLCETLIEKNVIHPSQLAHVPSDHSSRPSHHGTTPVDDSADYVGEFDDII